MCLRGHHLKGPSNEVPEVSTVATDLNRFQSLQSLRIRGKGLTDHFVSSSTFPANLVSLSLESDFLTEKSFTWALAATENLQSLHLSSTALTSIDPEPVRSHKKLVVLNIPKTAITFSVTETLFTRSVLDRISTRDFVVLRRR